MRIAAFAGLGAFALSVIIAAFSRIPFFILVLRALLSGIGFAGLVFAALFFLERFVPELLSDSDDSKEENAATGSIVDIVLPQEDGFVQYDGSKPQVSSNEPLSKDFEQELNNIGGEALFDAKNFADADDRTELRPSATVGDLDILPDLDKFNESFADTIQADNAENMSVSDTMPTASSPHHGEDPALIAKAVQTLLRKDQKGPQR